MLRFSNSVFYDNEADAFAKQVINKALLKRMELAVRCAAEEMCIDIEKPNWHKVVEGEPIIFLAYPFTEYFPETMNIPKRLNTFCGLYSLLLSEKEFIPVLEMEYFLAYLIKHAIFDSARITGISKDKKKMLEHAAIATVREDKAESSDSEEEYDRITAMPENEFCDMYKKDIRKKKRAVERFSEDMLELCLWDCDYELLDMVKCDDDFRESELNRFLQAVPKDKEEDRYFYPEHWWQDQGFCIRSQTED